MAGAACGAGHSLFGNGFDLLFFSSATPAQPAVLPKRMVRRHGSSAWFVGMVRRHSSRHRSQDGSAPHDLSRTNGPLGVKRQIIICYNFLEAPHLKRLIPSLAM
jgi:hypothetical protein